MNIHNQIKEFRIEEMEKDPPPYHLEMSTPSYLKEHHSPDPRLCKVYYSEEMLEYKEKICQRIRQRFIDIGIELEINI